MADNGNSGDAPEISAEAKQFMKDAVADPERFRLMTGYTLGGDDPRERLESMRNIIEQMPGESRADKVASLMTTVPVSQAYLDSLHADAARLTDVETALGQMADANHRLAEENNKLTDRVVRAEAEVLKVQVQMERYANLEAALDAAELPAPYDDKTHPEPVQPILLKEEHVLPESRVLEPGSADSEMSFAGVLDEDRDAAHADLGLYESSAGGADPPMASEQLYAWEDQLKARQEELDRRDSDWKGVQMEAQLLASRLFNDKVRASRTGSTPVPEVAQTYREEDALTSIEVGAVSEEEQEMLDSLDEGKTPAEYEADISDLDRRLRQEISKVAARDAHIDELEKDGRRLAGRWADLDERYSTEVSARRSLESELAHERAQNHERAELITELSDRNAELDAAYSAVKSTLDGRETLLMYLTKSVSDIWADAAAPRRAPIKVEFVSCSDEDPEVALATARTALDEAGKELAELTEYRMTADKRIRDLQAEVGRLKPFRAAVDSLTADLEAERRARADSQAEAKRLESELADAGRQVEELGDRLAELEVEKKIASEWTREDYAVQLEAAGFPKSVADKISLPIMVDVQSGTPPVDALIAGAMAYVEKDIVEKENALEAAKAAHDSQYRKRIDNLKTAENLTEDGSHLSGIAIVLTEEYALRAGYPKDDIVYQAGMEVSYDNYADHRIVNWLRLILKKADVRSGKKTRAGDVIHYFAAKICDDSGDADGSDTPIAYVCAMHESHVSLNENMTQGVVSSLSGTIRTQFNLQQSLKRDLDYAGSEYPAMLERLRENTTI